MKDKINEVYEKLQKKIQEVGTTNQRLGNELKEDLEETNKAVDTMKKTMKKANDITEEKLAAVDGERRELQAKMDRLQQRLREQIINHLEAVQKTDGRR